MGRSTFEGPILSGDNRFGDLRNVGSVELYQYVTLNVTNTTPNTAGYGGGSSVFVDSNGIPNGSATVYSPSATAYPPVAATPTADAAGNVYRGWVAYIPANSRIVELVCDCGVVPAVAGGTATLSSAILYVSNGFTANGGTPAYGSVTNITAVGRQSFATASATQLANWQATSTDVTQANGQPNVSQIVFTLNYNGTTLDTRTSIAGTLYFTVAYIQADGNIGSTTAYPYGNFD